MILLGEHQQWIKSDSVVVCTASTSAALPRTVEVAAVGLELQGLHLAVRESARA
jgi:hypothetical protein